MQSEKISKSGTHALKNVHAIDFFCGVGGLTHGLQMAGIDVQAGFDSDPSCRYAYEANNKGAQFVTADIRKIGSTDVSPYLKNADIKMMVGCAPCQPFSTHTGKLKTNDSNPSWNLINEFLRIILECRPEIISMENVPGLMKKAIYQEFKQKLRDAGYEISDRILNCSDFGVPQSRKRLVMFGSLLGEIEFPEPTCAVKKTVREVIGKLPPLEHGHSNEHDPLHKCSRLEPLNQKRIQASSPGRSWRDWPKNLLPDCYKKDSGASYGSVYGRMEWDKIAPTLTTLFYRYGTGRFGHPNQDRALSLREGALLQTFPLNYRFSAPDEVISFAQAGRHIGNAVPPALARIIGDAITSHLNQMR